MSKYPTITRVRPLPASSAGSERKRPRASSTKHASAENSVSAVIALGSLIVGLRVKGLPPRRT